MNLQSSFEWPHNEQVSSQREQVPVVKNATLMNIGTDNSTYLLLTSSFQRSQHVSTQMKDQKR